MFRNVSAQWIRTIIFIVAGLILPPLMDHFLGTETYGTWGLIMATTSFLRLLSIGLPLATVQSISARVTKGRLADVNETIGTSLRIFVGIGLISLALGIGFFAFFESVYVPSIKIPEDVSLARVAFWIVLVQVAISFLVQLPYAVFAGHQHFVLQNRYMVMATLLRTALVAAVLLGGGSLIALAIVELVVTALEVMLPALKVKSFYEGIEFAWSRASRQRAKELLQFGGYIVLVHVGIRLCFETDSLVIGAFIDQENVAYYSRSNAFIVYLIEIMTAVGGVIIPLSTQLSTSDRMAELREIFLKWSKITFSGSILIGLFLLVLGPEFVTMWMQNANYLDPARAVVPALILSGFLFLPVRAVAMSILLGMGKIKFPGIFYLFVGFLNLGISLALVPHYGLFGVALGTAIPNVIFAVVMLIYTCKETETPLGEFLLYVCPRCLLGALPVAAFLYWWRETFAPSKFVDFLAPGFGSALLFGLIWFFFVYHNDRLVDLRAQLRERFGRD